jgi:hypothetical protein
VAVYAVQGKLGTGKSKFCVWMAKQAIYDGRRVAGNLDIRPEKLNPSKPGRYQRVPDKPTASDLDALGHGNPDSYDESRNGVLILDELGTWLNARSFQDKSRAEILDWLIHARKKGWDVYLIVQNVVMIDKQVRESLIEYSCNCLRMDKVKVPFIGWFLHWLGDTLGAIIGNPKPFKKWGYLPFFHLVVARIGEGANSVVADRWTYVGKELHDAYDTRQIFRSDYDHGTFSVLPPWDYAPPRSSLARLLERLRLFKRSRLKPRPLPRPKPPALQLIASLPDPAARIALTKRYHTFIDKQNARSSNPVLMPR